MAALRGIALALILASALGLKTSQPQPPPDPVGKMPDPDKDGAYKSEADACAACKFAATKSCAMYKTCICHSTNAHFPIVGLPEPTDTQNFHWSCGGEGGDMYKKCFSDPEQYVNAFGDKVDPNDKKCDFGEE